MQLVDPRTGEYLQLRRVRPPVRAPRLKDDHEPVYWLAIVTQAVTIGLLI